MENIGIMTHCAATNFGANLQALSTANFLQNNGYKPVFFRWSDYLNYDEQNPQAIVHRKFLENQGFIVSDPCKSDEDFRKVILKYNIHNIIVGSDCILTYHNKKLFPYILTRKGFIRIEEGQDYQFPNPFWLPFVREDDDISLYMISGSCGSSDIPHDETIKHEMSGLLGRFSYISVRDTYTRKMVHSIIGEKKEIHLTPDPVFGFNYNRRSGSENSKENLIAKFSLPQKYFVISFYYQYWPSQAWANELMRIAHQYGIACVSIPMPLGKRKSDFDLNLDCTLDPLEWYDIIRYSEGYIGNNMHPMIVALHNGVPFFDFNIHGKFILQRKIQVVSTSKEVDLLKRFKLCNYQIAQQRHFLTSPQKIIKKLLEFDRAYCGHCASILQTDYITMMNTILDQIKQRV